MTNYWSLIAQATGRPPTAQRDRRRRPGNAICVACTACVVCGIRGGRPCLPCAAAQGLVRHLWSLRSTIHPGSSCSLMACQTSVHKKSPSFAFSASPNQTYNCWQTQSQRAPVSDCSSDSALEERRNVDDWLHVCLANFQLCPRVECASFREKKVCHGTSVNPLIILNTSSKSPRFLLSSNDHNPSLSSRVSYGKLLRFVNSLVKRCWTSSSRDLSFW